MCVCAVMLTVQVKIWFQNRRMKWKRGKKASMEARAKQNAAAAANSDKSKPEPETHRKPEAPPERHHVTNNNNAAHARNANDFRAAETGSGKMAAPADLYVRRPTSVIAFSVPAAPGGKMATDEQRAAFVGDRKTSLTPFGVLSLS